MKNINQKQPEYRLCSHSLQQSRRQYSFFSRMPNEIKRCLEPAWNPEHWILLIAEERVFHSEGPTSAKRPCPHGSRTLILNCRDHSLWNLEISFGKQGQYQRELGRRVALVALGYSSLTVSNSLKPSRVHIRLCKHGKRFLLLKDLIKTYNNS